MQRLFLDCNIVIDLLGEREPFYEPIAKLATLAEKGKIKLVVSPITYATVCYVLSKFESAKVALEKLRRFKVIVEVCTINELVVEKALNSSFPDFEDALQYFSAIDAECNIIITRNGKDFKKSMVPIMTGDEYLKN